MKLTLVHSLALLPIAACVTLGASPRVDPGDGLRAGADASRPNILLLVGDDHGRADSGCYGHAQARTPHLDQLAREGMRFTDVHAVTAICQPSRAALLTGRYPLSNGVYGFYPLDPGVRPVSALLATAGYECALVGKRHIAPIEQYRFAYAPPMTQEQGREPGRYLTDVRGFLDQRDTDAPFFLFVAFHDPHRPFPTTGVDSGSAAAVAVPVDRNAVVPPAPLPSLPAVREDVAGYLDAVGRLDAAVGAILSELERRGLDDETLVIYTADHGPPFPFAKTTLYERGLAVPFLARWPGQVQAGSEIDGLFGLLDVAPTLLDVAGSDAPSEMQGTSFAAVLRGKPTNGHEWLWGSQTDHLHLPSTPMRSLRTTRYRYIYNFHPERQFLTDALGSPTWSAMVAGAESDPLLAEHVNALLHRPTEELYDRERDPNELDNLANDDAHAETLRDFRALMVEQMSALDDPFLWLHPAASSEQRARARPGHERYLQRQELRLSRRRQRQR